MNQHRGRIEVLVDGPYDHEALKALVAGMPRDAYEVLETAGAAEAAAVSPAGSLRRFLRRLGRFMRRSGS